MPRFERSSDASLLVAALEQAETGKLVTYDELGKAIGRTVAGHYGPLHTARRVLLRERGMVFAAEPGKGIIRLDDGGVVKSAVGDRTRIHRAAHRAVTKLSTVNTDVLDPTQTRNYYTELAMVGAISEATRANNVKKISSTVNGRSAPLPVADTLRALL